MTANPFLFLFLWAILWITELRASNGVNESNANGRESTCECMKSCFNLELQGNKRYEQYQRRCGYDSPQWEDCSLNKDDNQYLDSIQNQDNGDDPCRCCLDMYGSEIDQLTQTSNPKYDNCKEYSREQLEINLDLYWDGILENNSNNRLILETMSNIASQSIPENPQQPSKLFNHIFNPPSFIFSQDMQYLFSLQTFTFHNLVLSFTMIEASGELKIINRSENLKLTIGEILKDSDILRVENYSGDVLPNKEKTIRFYVVPSISGDQQQINLFFKLSFFDTIKAKQISAKTVQYTILLQSVKENRLNIIPFHVEAHQDDSKHQSTPILLSNPTSETLQIHTASLLKKQFLISFEEDSEGLQSLVTQASPQTKKWSIEPETNQQIVFLICSLKNSGSFYDVLRITFIDSSLVMEIPIIVQVQSNSIGFSRSQFNMGIISNSQGFNSRFIEIDNYSSDFVEIQDITILFNKGQACVAADKIITENKDKPSSANSSKERIIIKPFEKKKIIGKLKVFYDSISDIGDPNSLKMNTQENIPKKYAGKLMVLTNLTATPFEIEFSFFRDIHILDYISRSTSFYVQPIPLLSNITHPHTPLPKSIEIQNIFPVQQKITGLIVPAETGRIFKFSQFQEKILESGESKVIVQVQELGVQAFTNDTSAGIKQQQTFVLLQLNKKLVVPIFFSTFNMMLSCSINDSLFQECSSVLNKDCSMNFGSKAMGEIAYSILRLKNRNPDPIQISQITKSNSAVKLNILLNFEQKGFANNESASKILIPDQNGSTENLMLNLGAGEEIIIEVQLETQAPIVSNLNEAIMIKTQFQNITIPLVYKVIEGEITVESEELVFNGTNSKLMQFVKIRNSFDVDLMVQGIRNDNPRFKILDIKKIIKAKSAEHLMTIVFNRTYDYGQNIQSASEENFISFEDFEQANLTSYYENKIVTQRDTHEQVIKPEIWIDFNVKSVKLDITAFNQRIRLLDENKIEFNNSEIHSFYQKTLTFSNPLEVPILFQLFISPDNIFTKSIDSKNSQHTAFDNFPEPEEEEFTFCIPMNLHKNPLIKEVYENLSDFFSNKGMEQQSEIQDQDVLKRIQTHPDFDKSQLPMILQLIETLQIFSSPKDDNEQLKQSCSASSSSSPSSSCSNPNGFFCKKGLISEKVKNYMQKIEFSKTLMEFYQSPNIYLSRMQTQIEHIKALSKEIIEISSYSNAHPKIFGLGTSSDKGILEKIMHFFKNIIPFGKITSKTLRDYTLISNWQSTSTDLFSQNKLIQDNQMMSQKKQQEQGLKNLQQQQQQQQSQQVYLGIDVSNRTILIQPKQTLKLNSLIFLPQNGEISSNLIIKTNASAIDVIPIKGHSGIGKLQLMEVRNLSPMMLGNTTFIISEEEKVYQENVKQQIKQGVFLFSMKSEEVELAYRHKQDILKNFVIQNNGEYSIHVKNIYFESQSCSGYGFFILGCICTFKLEPGQEKIITIGYRSNYPHDTLTKNIYFYTSSYNFKFIIRAELSPIKQQLYQQQQQQQQYTHMSDNFKRSAIFLSSQMEGITERQEDSEKMLQILLENVEKATKLAQNEENRQEWVWMASKPRSFDSLEKIGQNFVLTVVLVTAVFFIYTFTSFFITDVLKIGQKTTKSSKLSAVSSQSIQALTAQQEAESKMSNSASQYCIQAFQKSHIIDSNILNFKKDLLKIKELQEQKKQEHLFLEEELIKVRKRKREEKIEVVNGAKESAEIDNSKPENLQGQDEVNKREIDNEDAQQLLPKPQLVDEGHQETEKKKVKTNKMNSREHAKKEKQKQSQQFKKVVSQQDKKIIQDYINNENTDIQNLRQNSENQDEKLADQQESSSNGQQKQQTSLLGNKEEGQVQLNGKLTIPKIKEEKIKQSRKIDDSIQREIEQTIQRHQENMLRLAQQKENEEQSKQQEIIKKIDKEEKLKDDGNIGQIHQNFKSHPNQQQVGSTIQTNFTKGSVVSYQKEDDGDGQKNPSVDEQQLQNTWETEQVEHLLLDTDDNFEEKQQLPIQNNPIEELETFRGTLQGLIQNINQNELNKINVHIGVTEEIVEDKVPADRQSQDIEFQFTERTVEETESNFIEEDEDNKYQGLHKKESNCSSSIINHSSEEDFSSGDSLSEEEIDTFRKKTDAIKPIGFNLSSLTWRAQNKQDAGNNINSNNLNTNNTNNSFNEEDSYYSGGSSLRESFHNEIGVISVAQQTQQSSSQEYQISEFNKTQQKPHLSGFINYQSESSDDESNPIKQRRYFNLFNPQPCIYPISFLSQTLQPQTENEMNSSKQMISQGLNKKANQNQHLVSEQYEQSEITNKKQVSDNIHVVNNKSATNQNTFSYTTSPSQSQSHPEMGLRQDTFPSLSFPIQTLPVNSTSSFTYMPSSSYSQNSSNQQTHSQEDKQLSEKLDLIKRTMSSSSSPSTTQFIPNLGPPPGMGLIPRTQQQFHQGNSTESAINLVKQSSNKQQQR